MPSLVRHPDTPPGAIHVVEAELERAADGAVARFRAIGDVSRLVVPPPAAAERADGLWRTTCFELFVSGEGPGYLEFNLSPSGAWAAYQFDGHRNGMSHLKANVDIKISSDKNSLTLISKIEYEFPDCARVGLTAVIEEADGAIRYWATAFAPGKPDFHAAAVRCLILDGVSAQ